MKDERVRAESGRVNSLVLLATAVVTVLFLVGKAFFLEFNFRNYGAELIALGIVVLYGIAYFVLFLVNKRIDERVKAIMSRIATVCVVTIFAIFLAIIIIFAIISWGEYTPQVHIFYTSAVVIVTSVVRMIKTKTVPAMAAELEYPAYKKRVLKGWMIALAICAVVGISLVVIGAVLENYVLVIVSFVLLWTAVPTCILSPIFYLMLKKSYDKQLDNLEE